MSELEEMIRMIDDNRKPFVEKRFGPVIVRVFNPRADKHLFKWHQDDRNRVIEVIHSGDWQFQLDNEHPKMMKSGDMFLVFKEDIHRIIPGTSPLWVKIIEY